MRQTIFKYFKNWLKEEKNIILSKSAKESTTSYGCESVKRDLGWKLFQKENFQSDNTKYTSYRCKVDSSLLENL